MKAHTELEAQFFAACKIIDLKYEYNGYTGTERYGLITHLLEKEIQLKYGEQLDSCAPYIVLNSALGDVRADFERNNWKFENRLQIDHQYGVDDGFAEHHSDCAVHDCAEQVIRSEELCELKAAIRELTPIQQRRLLDYYFNGKSYRRIATE